MLELKDHYNIQDLIEIMRLLRGENGCPWDREQDHTTIRSNILEEAYEVAQAIDSGNTDDLKEELGDVLLQVVFHAQIAQESNTFQFDDVCDTICKKLIYRHPHVFSNIHVEDADEVLRNWDALKAKSKGEETVTDRLESVPKLLPALMRGEKVGKRAASVGFDFRSVDEVLNILKSEIQELEEAIKLNNDTAIEDEFGDVLFSCCNLARFLKKDSEKALTFSINKFIMRFRELEQSAKKPLNMLSYEELDELWNAAKKKINLKDV